MNIFSLLENIWFLVIALLFLLFLQLFLFSRVIRRREDSDDKNLSMEDFWFDKDDSFKENKPIKPKSPQNEPIKPKPLQVEPEENLAEFGKQNLFLDTSNSEK